jgi:hypothetical protein
VRAKTSTNADNGFGVDGEVEGLFSGGFDGTPLVLVEGVGGEEAAHGRGDNGLERLLVNRKTGGRGIAVADGFEFLTKRTAVEGGAGDVGITNVADKKSRKVITIPSRAHGAVDALKEALQTKALKIRNAKLPEHTRRRSGAVQPKRTTKGNGDELVEIVEVRLGGSPELGRIRHLRNEDGLDEGGGDKRTRRSIASVDPGNEVGSVRGFGDNGVELLVPFAVALDDEAEILVMVDQLDLMVVEGDGTTRQTRIGFVFNKENLGLDGGEFQLPLVAPGFNKLEEFVKNVVLGEVGLITLVLRPASTIIGKEGEDEA